MSRFFLFLSLFLIAYNHSSAQIDMSIFANKGEVNRISGIQKFVKRSQLSFNGIYNSGNYDLGYDIEYVVNHIPEFVEILNRMDTEIQNHNFNDLNEIPTNSSLNREINNNSQVIQYRIFIEILKFIYTYHNQHIQDFNYSFPGLNFNMQFIEGDYIQLLSDLKQSDEKFLLSEHPNATNDYVQWTASLTNYARAIDLYLTFEIVAQEYNAPSYYFLNEVEKKALLFNLARGIVKSKFELESVQVPGTSMNQHEAEPGNRPLKMYAAMGIACQVITDVIDLASTPEHDTSYGLGQNLGLGTVNGAQIVTYFYNLSNNPINNSLGLKDEGNQRLDYWSYQSNGGERDWAEGPYYLDFALREVISFWHTYRIAGIIDQNENPFSNANLLNL